MTSSGKCSPDKRFFRVLSEGLMEVEGSECLDSDLRHFIRLLDIMIMLLWSAGLYLRCGWLRIECLDEFVLFPSGVIQSAAPANFGLRVGEISATE